MEFTAGLLKSHFRWTSRTNPKPNGLYPGWTTPAEQRGPTRCSHSTHQACLPRTGRWSSHGRQINFQPKSGVLGEAWSVFLDEPLDLTWNGPAQPFTSQAATAANLKVSPPRSQTSTAPGNPQQRESNSLIRPGVSIPGSRRFGRLTDGKLSSRRPAPRSKRMSHGGSKGELDWQRKNRTLADLLRTRPRAFSS